MSDKVEPQEEIYEEEEVNIINEPDYYSIQEDEYTLVEEEEVITDELPSIGSDTMDLIEMGKKIKSTHVTNKFQSKKGQ